VLVAAVRRDQRDEALRELLGQLGLAGFGALVIAAVVGERLAKAALRPVERYRAQADSIAAGQLGLRLDVPADRDDEVTRLGHTFNDVLGALERAVEHERRFVQDASHELRTPLTLLSARIQLLRRRTRTLDEHERALDELETDIGALRALADQLLDIGTATDAPTQPAPTATDISATLHRMRLTGTDTTLHTDPGATLTDMPADQVRQIVANLITNARTHGQPPYTITVRTIPGAVVITVNDAGPGMPAAFLPVAADRFRRGDDTRLQPGAGIGLALIDVLVSRHGGELRLCALGHHHRTSETLTFPCDHPETGTTATVALPSNP